MLTRLNRPTRPSGEVIPAVVSHVAMLWKPDGLPSTSMIDSAALGICVILYARNGSAWLLMFMRYDAGMSSASNGSVNPGVDDVLTPVSYTHLTLPTSDLV